MKISTSSFNLVNLIKRLPSVLGGKIERGCEEWRLDVPGDTGVIHVLDFEDGLQCMIINARPELDWELHFDPVNDSPFIMYFLVRGQVSLRYSDKDEQIGLVPLQTLFLAMPGSCKQTILINGEADVLLLVLHIQREIYIEHIDCFSKEVTKELSGIFSGRTVSKKLSGNQDYGLNSAALLQEVLDDKQEGLPRATFIESKVLQLFSLQLRKWEEDIEGTEPRISLHAQDVDKLEEARRTIMENLQNAPTIEELSKKVGLNRQKLKKGFKRTYGRTINEYLRNERLKLARQLLESGRPVIKDVAARVGYENASYFARRFKGKYGVYPNEYLKAKTNGHTEEE